MERFLDDCRYIHLNSQFSLQFPLAIFFINDLDKRFRAMPNGRYEHVVANGRDEHVELIPDERVELVDEYPNVRDGDDPMNVDDGVPNGPNDDHNGPNDDDVDNEQPRS